MSHSKRVRILDKLVTFFDDWSCIGLDLSEFTFEDIQIYQFKNHTTMVIWHGQKFRPVLVREDRGYYFINYQHFEIVLLKDITPPEDVLKQSELFPLITFTP